jgi:hypothetical protein
MKIARKQMESILEQQAITSLLEIYGDQVRNN